jgi:hypothetical protein
MKTYLHLQKKEQIFLRMINFHADIVETTKTQGSKHFPENRGVYNTMPNSMAEPDRPKPIA